MENEPKMNVIAKVRINNGTDYVFCDDGSIYEVIAPGKYKKVNDIIDKDEHLKNKILKQFDNSHNTDVVKPKEKIVLDIKDEVEEIELPEL